MANTSVNTTALIRQQLYSALLQKSLDDGFLPEGLTRDMSEFMDGDTLNVPTLGDLQAHSFVPDVAEEQMVQADALDTGRITLTITDYDGVAWYETRKLFEDSYLKGVISTEGMDRAMRAMKIAYEANMLSAHNAVQTASAVNAVNGAAHRYVAAGTSQVITLNDIAYARYALDKANVPEEGRVAIVSPEMALTLDKLVAGQAFINNPEFIGMVGEGFRKNMKFIRHIYGFDFWVSNRLPTLTETIDASAYGLANTTATGGKANFFFSVAEDAKPVMSAWRRRPELETWDEKGYLDTRDYYKITARYGFATYRPQGLVTVLTGPTG